MPIASLNEKTINMPIGDSNFTNATEDPNYYDDSTALDVLNELSKRLSDLEGSVELAVPESKIMSKLLLTKEAALLTADRVAILGTVTFADYIRDQNGEATGVIDPKITQIIGDKIRTGIIQSVNWSPTEGSRLDLDAGEWLIGGGLNPTFSYDNSVSTLTLKGKMVIKNKTDDGTDVGNITEYGYYSTGDANFDTATGIVSGSGTIVGTPGIYGVNSDKIVFGLNAETGSMSLGENGNPTLTFDSPTETLTLKGKMIIKDKTDDGTDTGNVTQHGYYATGDANFNTSTGVLSGSGVIMGTPGIYGVKNGEVKFGFDSATGFAVIKGDLLQGSSIDSGIYIGTKTGLEMQSETFAASVAAANAQLDATASLGYVADPSYIAGRLSQNTAEIIATSTNFIKVAGTGLAGIFLGSAGLFGKDAGGGSTFSVNASNGNATFRGSIAVGSVVDSGIYIGTKTGLEMQGDTATAIANAATADGKAVTADGKAVTADGKAVVADGKAVTADGKAVAAQSTANTANSTANTAYSNVISPTYIAGRLSQSTAAIHAANKVTLYAGSTSGGQIYNGIALGDAGLVGRKNGVDTFSVDLNGNAVFKGDISGASGTFTGQINTSGMLVSADASGDAVVIQNNSNLSAGLYIYGTGSTAMVVLSGVSNFKNATFDGSVQVNGQLRSYTSGDDDLGGSSYYWRNAYLTTAYITQMGKDLKSRTIRPDITGTGYECGIAASRWWKVNAQYGNFDYVNCATQVTVPLLTVTNDIVVTDNITLSGKLLKSTWADGKIEVSVTNDGVADATYYYRFV